MRRAWEPEDLVAFCSLVEHFARMAPRMAFALMLKSFDEALRSLLPP
ncbi:MAG: hypothetical protein ACR2LX_02790 [Jatrophihabitans sp.]